MYRLQIKLLSFVLSFLLCLVGLHGQQLQLTGKVFDAENEQPIDFVAILVNGVDSTYYSNDQGAFQFKIPKENVLEISFLHELYESLTLTLQPVGEVFDVGTLYLTMPLDETTENLPTIVLNEQEFGDDDSGAEDVSGLLSASPDPFARLAAFDLSWARFRMRGLDSENQDMVINGIPTNDLETGRILWSTWGGLNDAVRARRDIINMNVTDFSFGGLGGAGYIDIRPSGMRKMTRISYANSNGNYRHRLMGFYNSGINKKGWGLAASFSKRYAEEGYVEGTFYDAWSYFLSIEKRINDRHSINVAAFGASNRRGRNSAVVQEAYDLRDPERNELYNPNWGLQNGEKRNARIADAFQPVYLISHDWMISERVQLTTGISYRTGKYGTSSLDWNNASDPRPDYYRYLPSWEEDPDVADQVADQWRTNLSVSQIDWDRMIIINRNVNETIYNVDGIDGNNVTGARARYIVEERRFDPNVLSFSSNLRAALSEKSDLYGGITYVRSRTDNYKLVDDLLGADFLLDVDKYAEGDFANPNEPAPDIIQSDLLHPNRLVETGDVFGYNYEIFAQQAKAWLQYKYENQKIIAYGGGQIGHASFWRNGNYLNGLHQLNSLGESEKESDLIYGLKAGLTFKVDGRNYIYANVAYGENPARARDGFISPRVDNRLNPYNDTWQHIGYDIGYQIRTPFIKARVSLFHNERNDLTRSLLFYNDFRNTFGNYIIGNLDYILEGVEGGAEIKIFPTLTATAGFSFMNNRVSDRAIASSIDDRSLEFISKDEVLYLKNYKISGMPNTVGNLGLTYNSPKFWWLSMNGSYFDDTYIDVSPVRRTSEAVELLDPNSELYQSILSQEEVGGEFILNLMGGYSYRIKYGQYIRFFVSINNILDNRDFISGGFEQLRFDNDNRDPNVFPSRYYYNYGRTYFASITYQF